MTETEQTEQGTEGVEVPFNFVGYPGDPGEQETDGDDEGNTGAVYVSMTASIDQPNTATRSTSAQVPDPDDLAEELLRSAGGLAEIIGVGEKFRSMVSPCIHAIKVVHEAHPDATTRAAERAAEVAAVLARHGFSTTEPTDDLAAAVDRSVIQRNAKTAKLTEVADHLNSVRRDDDPLDTVSLSMLAANRLSDYRANLAAGLGLDPNSKTDSELMMLALARLGIGADVNADQLQQAHQAYADAMAAIDRVNHSEHVAGESVTLDVALRLRTAAQWLGALLGRAEVPDPAAPDAPATPLVTQD